MASTAQATVAPTLATEFYVARVDWSPLQRIGFRFVCAYLILYTLPAPGRSSLIAAIPGTSFLTRPYVKMWRATVEWVAAHVFHLSGSVAVYPQVNGSGDSTLDYIQVLCFAVLAAVAAQVWSIFDRKRAEYRRLHAWLRIWVRYTLAFTLFGYGFAKVFPLQFQPPNLSRLMEPFHDFSPMGVLWTFMGASMAYTIFAGAAEVLGGLLLLFPRATSLGALVSAAVLLNVVMLNFCYDVPVKLYSANLLLMAVFLAAPDLGRLANVFLWNRPTRPSKVDSMLFRTRGWKIVSISAKTLLIGFTLFSHVKGGIQGYRTYYTNAPRSPLYGIWEVEKAETSGVERWKYVILDRPQAVSIRMMDDSQRFYASTYDEANRRITLRTGGGSAVFQYARPDLFHLTLQGDGRSISLHKVDMSKFLLVNRGFHWINERPFNR